jgi:hypothetical protein
VPVRRRPDRRRLRCPADAGELVSPPPAGRAPPPERGGGRSPRAGFRLCRRLCGDRLHGAQERHQAVPDLLGRLVAVRLRQLRTPDDPHGLALGRHLSDRRWARRSRHRHAALRADLELVGQRQHRQVAPSPAADQAQVRQCPVVGRSDGAHRQLRPGDHGPADLRLRRRPPRRLGGRRRHLLGPRGRRHGHGVELRRHGEPRQALARQERRRRLRPGEPARGLPPVAHLRQPGGALRQSASPSPAWR